MSTAANSGSPLGKALGIVPRENLLPLLAITLIGALLRFISLDQPALWADEAAVYWPVTGHFSDTLRMLRGEKFVPLHFLSYTALAKFTLLSPFMMRLIPALTGTLLIPAIYLLARQILDRRIAMVAALFAALSAYGLIYSRDAKMYMPTWFFLTLFLAFLLLWWRRQRTLYWLLWVLCGCLASMYHVTSLVIIILTPLCGLALRGWGFRKVLLFTIGLALIFAGPAAYFTQKNSFLNRTGLSQAVDVQVDVQAKKWENSGLGWVEEFNEGVGPWRLVLNTAAGFIFGVQWPREKQDPVGFDPDPPSWFLPVCVAAMTLIGWLLVLGLWPWQRSLVEQNDQRHLDTPEPSWRAALWLMIWIVVPTYGFFYCRSFKEFVPPWHWFSVVWMWFGWWWLPVVVITGFTTWTAGQKSKLGTTMAYSFAIVVHISVVAAIIIGRETWAETWLELMKSPWTVFVLLILGAGAFWWASASLTQQRRRTLFEVVSVVSVLFVICIAAWLFWTVFSVFSDPEMRTWHSIWMPRYLGIVYPAVIIAVAWLLMRLPGTPLRVLAIVVLLSLNLTQAIARIVVPTEPPWPRISADVWQSVNDDESLVVLDAAGDLAPAGRWFGDKRCGYYVDMAAGQMQRPDQLFRQDRLSGVWHDFLRRPGPEELARYLIEHQELENIVIWDRLPSAVSPKNAGAGGAEQLNDGWSIVMQDCYATHQFWTWRSGCWFRRMEYKKTSSAKHP